MAAGTGEFSVPWPGTYASGLYGVAISASQEVQHRASRLAVALDRLLRRSTRGTRARCTRRGDVVVSGRLRLVAHLAADLDRGVDLVGCLGVEVRVAGWHV